MDHVGSVEWGDWKTGRKEREENKPEKKKSRHRNEALKEEERLELGRKVPYAPGSKVIRQQWCEPPWSGGLPAALSRPFLEVLETGREPRQVS